MAVPASTPSPPASGVPRLCAANLNTVATVARVPRYDRSSLRTGIAHIGVGHFHRAHQARYLDTLLRAGKAEDWAICGIGVRPSSERLARALAPQDLLYTAIEKSADGRKSCTIVGALVRYLTTRAGTAQVIAQLADPNTRVVTLTVTEGGYGLDPGTGSFSGAGVRDDLNRSASASATSWIGILLEALERRQADGTGGLTVLSCDNIVENGRAARTALLGFAMARHPNLIPFLEEEVAFPNSMVDRVVPATTQADREFLAAECGYEDAWPVASEPFSLWVIEDTFAAGRPALDEAGAQLVADVRPYEIMKLRLANGTHQALCYFGALLGHRFVHEALADPDVRCFVERYQISEVLPTLSPVAGTDARSWGQAVIERFSNPAVADTLARICEDATDRLPKFVLPVPRANLSHGGSVRFSAAIVAGWARYLEGTDEHGHALPQCDPLLERLRANLRRDTERPGAFIEDERIFGDLARDAVFIGAYRDARALLRERGARALLRMVPR